MDWVRAYLAKLDGKEVVCPECGAGQVSWRLAGDPASRFGYAILWCGQCGKGDRLSRVQFPVGVELVSMFDEAEVTKGVPDGVFVAENSPTPPKPRASTRRRGGRGT